MVCWVGVGGGVGVGGQLGLFPMVSPPSGAWPPVQPLVRLMDPQCTLLMVVVVVLAGRGVRD